jgi:hypothetical protein
VHLNHCAKNEQQHCEQLIIAEEGILKARHAVRRAGAG